jgi:hypothetical protein
VGLGTVIFSNWDAIKKVLKDTGIWDGLATVVQGTVDLISGAFTMLKNVVSFAFAYMKKTFNDDTYGVFKIMGTVISTALTVVGNLFSVFGKALKGDWSGVWTGITNIVKSAWNGIIDVIATGEKAVLGTTSKLLNAVGATDKASMFARMSNEIDAFANKVKFKVPETTGILSTLGKALDNTLNGGGSTTPNFNGAGGGKEKKTKTGKDEFETNSAKLLSDALKIQTELYKKANEGNLRSEIDFLTQQFEVQKQSIQNEIASDSAKHVALLVAEEKFQADLQSVRSKYKTPDLLKSTGANLGGIGSTFNDGSSAFGKLQSVGNPVNPLANSIKTAIPTLEQYYAQMTDTTRQNMFNLNEQLSSGLSNATSSALAGLGGLIGAMAVGNASFGDIGNMLINTLGNMFGQMGEQMITAGVGLLALEFAITNPFAMIAAGVALTALKGALSSTVSNTRSGGSGSNGGSSGGSNGGSSGFNNPYTSGSSVRFQPIEVLIKGDSVLRGSDIVTTYTNQQSFNSRIRKR